MKSPNRNKGEKEMMVADRDSVDTLEDGTN